MPVINHWTLIHEDRLALIWGYEDGSVLGLDRVHHSPTPRTDFNTFAVVALGNGPFGLQNEHYDDDGQKVGPYASMRNDRTDRPYQVQFTTPSGAWTRWVGPNETFEALPWGDGLFVLYNRALDRFVRIDPEHDPVAPCNALYGPPGDFSSAARFSARGYDRPAVLDLIELSRSAAGMSFAGIDLRGHDLRGIGLTGCDFTEALNVGSCSFSDAVLTRARFRAVTFDLAALGTVLAAGAEFTGCTLHGESAEPPDFAGASFVGAHLADVSLPAANLAGADLSGADLSRAVLTGANLAGAVLRGTVLTGAVLDGADLTGAILDTDLGHTSLRDATLASVDLGAAKRPHLRLTGADLTGADLSRAVLSGADLRGCTLVGTDFRGQDLSQVRFDFPVRADTNTAHPTVFAGCTVPFALLGLQWRCLDLRGATIPGLAAADLTGLVADGVRCDASLDLSRRRLDGASFLHATLESTRFNGAALTSVAFRYARLVGVMFTGAVIRECSFASAALGGVRGGGAADFSSAFLSNCDFDGASLYGVDFAEATLVGQNVLTVGAAPGFDEANFANAYLPDVDFSRASLRGARFDGAFMVGCVLDGADLSPSEGAVRTSLTSARLQGVSFRDCRLDGADLTDAMIVDTRGRIEQQYYDADGLTPLEPMYYRATAFPAESSFDDDTTLPNAFTFSTNLANKASLAQMMTPEHPSGSWTPIDRAPSSGSPTSGAAAP